MPEEIPTEITCQCGSVAMTHNTNVEMDGEIWDVVYRCSRCGTDTYYKPTVPLVCEDMRGLRTPFRGDGG